MAAQRRPAGPEPCHRGAWQHEAKIGDSVFNQFETDIAAVEEKEFHPAFERSASSGRKPQMHLQADQRAVARIIDAAQAQLDAGLLFAPSGVALGHGVVRPASIRQQCRAGTLRPFRPKLNRTNESMKRREHQMSLCLALLLAVVAINWSCGCKPFTPPFPMPGTHLLKR